MTTHYNMNRMFNTINYNNNNEMILSTSGKFEWSTHSISIILGSNLHTDFGKINIIHGDFMYQYKYIWIP